MDLDGVAATVMYGPVSGIMAIDNDVRPACYQAYNEWLAEFCAASPNRLIGAGIIGYFSPEEAVAGIRQLAELGLPEAMFQAASVTTGLWHDSWEPLWAAAEEADIILGFHFGGGVRTVPAEVAGEHLGATGTALSVLPLKLDEPLTSVIFSGVLERHPKLKIVLAETGFGWIPFLLQRMEYSLNKYLGNREYWDQRGGINLSLRPTEYFQRQVWATFQEDHAGVRQLDMVGPDRVMWAADYPHADGTWPESQKAIQEQLGHLDEATKRMIVCDNARALYGLPETIV